MSAPSVQLYSVREAIESDLPGTIARLAEIGFTRVEPYAFHLRKDEYAAALSATGLAAYSGHAPVIDAEDPVATLDAAVELGMQVVIDPFVPAERWADAQQISATAARIGELTALADERGLRFGYHNHAWELSTLIDGRHALEVLADLLDPRTVLELDTYWAAVGGADVPALLERLGERVQLIHVKDGTLDGDTARQQPAGSGEIDVRSILSAAPSALRVVEFDAYGGDIFEGITTSLAWLKENDR